MDVGQPSASDCAGLPTLAGINAAKGKILAFLSHDDLWTPDKLSIQVTHLMSHPEIEYNIARLKFFLEPGCPVPPGFRKDLLQSDHIGRVMETLVVRKTLFDRIDRFRRSLATAHDVDWFARANDHAVAMFIIPKMLLYKRVHDSNLSLNTMENNEELLKALRDSIKRKRGGQYENNNNEK